MAPDAQAQPRRRPVFAPGCSNHKPPPTILEARRNGDRLIADGRRVFCLCDEPTPESPVPEYGVSKREWQRLRLIVFERDGYRCTYCGVMPKSPHCDHKTPRKRGGPTVLENLATACQPCNNGKKERTAEEWMAILSARQSANVAAALIDGWLA